VREIEFLTEARVSILSDRRRFAPYGLEGGQPGKPGKNELILPRLSGLASRDSGEKQRSCRRRLPLLPPKAPSSASRRPVEVGGG